MEVDEAQTEGRLLQKIKQNPFFPVGIVGMICAVAYGAYNYKNRGKMTTSVYLMQLRVVSQSMVVGTLALGVGYSLGMKILNDKPKHKD